MSAATPSARGLDLEAQLEPTLQAQIETLKAARPAVSDAELLRALAAKIDDVDLAVRRLRRGASEVPNILVLMFVVSTVFLAFISVTVSKSC